MTPDPLQMNTANIIELWRRLPMRNGTWLTGKKKMRRMRAH
jgi:hypothetical protein